MQRDSSFRVMDRLVLNISPTTRLDSCVPDILKKKRDTFLAGLDDEGD